MGANSLSLSSPPSDADSDDDERARLRRRGASSPSLSDMVFFFPAFLEAFGWSEKASTSAADKPCGGRYTRCWERGAAHAGPQPQATVGR